MDFAETLRRIVSELSLPAPPETALPALETHFQLMLRWNETINLTAERDPERALRRHVAESLAGLPHLPETAARLVDLGSGNGYPGLALAACRPDLETALVESAAKKAAFLRAAARDARLPRVRVVRGRIEGEDDLRALGEFDVFSCRGVASAGDWSRRVARCIAPGGRGLFFLSSGTASELERAESEPGGPTTRLFHLPTRNDAVLAVVDFR